MLACLNLLKKETNTATLGRAVLLISYSMLVFKVEELELLRQKFNIDLEKDLFAAFSDFLNRL